MILINALGFNVIWFGSVYLGNAYVPIALLILIAHLAVVNHVKEELLLICLVTMIGIIVDTFLMHLRVFVFNENNFFIPYWLITIWLAFAATLNHSLFFLQKYSLLRVLVSIFIVPMSYLAGHQLGAVNFSYSLPITFIILSVVWLFLFQLFFIISKKLKPNRGKYVLS